MTVSSATNRVQYAGDGVTYQFSFSFYIITASDLTVVYTDSAGNEKTLVNNSDYIVTDAGEPSGGYITLQDEGANGDWQENPPASGTYLTLRRVLTLEQQTDFVVADPLRAETLERAFDKVVMICQQIDEEVGRTIVLKESSLLSDIELPEGANRYLKWNSTGTALEAAAVVSLEGECEYATADAKKFIRVSDNGVALEPGNLTEESDHYDFGAKDLKTTGNLTDGENESSPEDIKDAVDKKHDAKVWGTKEVDESGLGDGKLPVYRSASGKYELESSFSAGMMLPWAGSEASPPSGWLMCDGQAVSRTTYAALYAIIGTTYGVGDGSTTFNLPDLRGKAPIGVNNATLPNGKNASLFDRDRADTGGEEEHTLTVAEMPSHGHTVKAAGDAGGQTGVVIAEDHLSSLISTNAAGSDGAHENMPPFVVINFIIKT